MTETWIILGATSAMARAFARALADRGAGLVLAARDLDEAEQQARDLRLRGAGFARAVAFDARRPEGFAALFENLGEGPVNAAVFAGAMPDQSAIDADPALIAAVCETNFTGPARVLSLLAPRIEAQGTGVIVGVGSVAGDRGRLGNYVYGASKAAFATYLSGLRNRLARRGGHVMTVKPGFVDTAMTWGLGGMFLVASPEAVAAAILKGVEARRNVIYVPGFWRAIMAIIRAIPEPIFKKLKI
ncbi:SDR family oxidoreductase [Mesobaculum littorinae]|uniref:SDR family oxidoreductase n=1 Tax=Mesobaculum littorinae TaxID=2486419 RepID=A0A438AIE3_9RHOB|nr:SDR family oxidoreductase [Mesobaculum littorinae]RVV98523.1 SDR family oxidoreductase [Mesobaculum littorinae]